jgi:hypothetical protein
MKTIETGTIKKLTTNELIKFTPTANVSIDPSASYKIMMLLMELIDPNPFEDGKMVIYDLNMFLRNTLEWKIDKQNGSFVKRVDKWLKENFKITATNEFLSKIGSYVQSEQILTKEEICFDFVSKIDWRPGEFGDGGSCLWGGRESGRYAMERSNDFYAVRLFKKIPKKQLGYYKAYYIDKDDPEAVYTGYARCWLWKYMVQKKSEKLIINNNMYVIFNAYGTNSLKVFSNLLSDYFGVDKKGIKLTNNDQTGGNIYINHGIGLLIGPQEIIQDITSIDFKQPT